MRVRIILLLFDYALAGDYCRDWQHNHNDFKCAIETKPNSQDNCEGYFNGGEAECIKLGCCFSQWGTNSDEPWCFENKKPSNDKACPAMKDGCRTPCKNVNSDNIWNIGPEECKLNGCIFCATSESVQCIEPQNTNGHCDKQEQYCTDNNDVKNNCGYEGIDRNLCEKYDCCWIPVNRKIERGTPWCFHKEGQCPDESCEDRHACPGVNDDYRSCSNENNCVWCPSMDSNLPDCISTTSPPTTTTTTTTTTTMAQLEQKHMLFLTGEVDGEKYPADSYRVHTDIFNAPVDGVQISKAAETPYGFYSSTGEDSDSLFQMILSSFVRLEEAGFDYERHIFCHGDLCKALDQMFLRYPDAAELLDVGGVFYMGHMSVPFDINEQGVLRTDFLDGVRKFYCIGQYDGKSTLLSAARAWNFTRSIDDSWFGITFGGRHRHFGGSMNFGTDDIEIFETSNTESTVHGKLREYFMFFMFNLEDRLELEQSYFEAEIRPIASELSEERFYTSLEGDLTNPDQSKIDNHLNPAIQQMFCEDAVEAIAGIKCSIYHEWRPEYGVGDGEGSDYEDIANSKPKVSFIEEENAMFIESYSHDYHQPHPGYTVPPQGIHGNASSIDLIFKLKNRKFIARAAGVKDWEAIPEDRCDEIIQLFETQALITLQNSKNGAQHLDKYAQYGCQHEVLTQRDTFGWFWLNSPVKYEFQDGKMTIEPNAFYTDETNTPEDNLDRLGGMLYCRIVGPARFLEWILADSFRKRNLRFC